MNKIKDSVLKSAKALWNVLPLIFGTILLFSLIITIIPKSFYIQVFRGTFSSSDFTGDECTFS